MERPTLTKENCLKIDMDSKIMKHFLLIVACLLIVPQMLFAHAGSVDRFLQGVTNFKAMCLVTFVVQLTMSVIFIFGFKSNRLNHFLKRMTIRLTANEWSARLGFTMLLCFVTAIYVYTISTIALFSMYLLILFGLCVILYPLIVWAWSGMIKRKNIYYLMHWSLQQICAFAIYAMICDTEVFRKYMYFEDDYYRSVGMRLYPQVEALSFIVEVDVLIYFILLLFPHIVYLLVKICFNKIRHRHKLVKLDNDD